jgi:hypothetical protein
MKRLKKSSSREEKILYWLHEKGLTVANHTHRRLGPKIDEYDIQDSDGYYRGTVIYRFIKGRKRVTAILSSLFLALTLQAQTYDTEWGCEEPSVGPLGVVLLVIVVIFLMRLIYFLIWEDL